MNVEVFMTKILGVFVVIFCLLLGSSTFASKIILGSGEKDVCNAEFKLQYPQGIDHVLFAVVHQDPMVYFKKQLTADQKKLKKHNSNQTMEMSKISEKEKTIINYWNYSLDMVTGSHIWELNNNTDKEHSSHKLTTNCFKKAWLVTRMTPSHQGIVGWSVSLNFKKDKALELALTPNNTINFKDLEKVYDSIVK